MYVECDCECVYVFQWTFSMKLVESTATLTAPCSEFIYSKYSVFWIIISIFDSLFWITTAVKVKRVLFFLVFHQEIWWNFLSIQNRFIQNFHFYDKFLINLAWSLPRFTFTKSYKTSKYWNELVLFSNFSAFRKSQLISKLFLENIQNYQIQLIILLILIPKLWITIQFIYWYVIGAPFKIDENNARSVQHALRMFLNRRSNWIVLFITDAFIVVATEMSFACVFIGPALGFVLSSLIRFESTFNLYIGVA